MKKKVITALCIAALFIPTVIAIVYYISVQNQPVSESSVDRLVLTDTSGKEFVFDKNDDKNRDEAKEAISFFIGMNEASRGVEEIPRQVKGTQPFIANYRSFSKEKEYKYFFSSDPGQAYYVDDQNRSFSIPSDKATEFLNKGYAECLFDAAQVPVLTLADSSKVEPKTVSWLYKNASDVFAKTITSGDFDVSQEFPISGGLVLNFTNQPDYINVKITRDGEAIFDGSYENVTPSVIGEINTSLAVEINAKWYQDTEKNYYGDIAYAFKANVTAPAEFYLGENTVEQGELVVVSGKNVTDLESLKFTSEPDLGFTPEFFRLNDYVVALVPISLDGEYVPQYVFTLTNAGISQDLTLNVTQRAAKANVPNRTSVEVVSRTKTGATLEAFKSALANVSASNDQTKYFEGVFVEPMTNNSIKAGYGRTVAIQATGETYVNHGVDYVVNQGDRVIAAGAGKVVYVGEQILSGRLVVIDHGLGLKSWYMHLGDVSVSVGDVVEKGAAIGSVGNGGFVDGYGLHYLFTVNGVAVNPYTLNDEGVVMYLGSN